jgi:hypothetical protein
MPLGLFRVIKNSRRGKGLGFLPFDRSNGRLLACLTRISKTLQVTQLSINFILPQRIVITRSIEVDDIAAVRTLEHRVFTKQAQAPFVYGGKPQVTIAAVA